MTGLEGLNLPELIDQLHDITVPPPVSYMPETIGWGVVVVVLVACIALLAAWIIARRRKDRYRRAALQELSAIERQANAGDVEHAGAEIAALVRRTALAAFPRDEVAHLYGEDWKAFLTRKSSKELGAGIDALIAAPYKPSNTAIDMADLARSAKRWIEHHSV
jgi:hypothetical protein